MEITKEGEGGGVRRGRKGEGKAEGFRGREWERVYVAVIGGRGEWEGVAKVF